MRRAQSKEKKKTFRSCSTEVVSNLQLDSDEGESENDEDDDLSDFDEDESDVNNDAVFEESWSKFFCNFAIVECPYSRSVKYYTGECIGKDWLGFHLSWKGM